jgi:enamine deaminase RidA (YjgF/YER057c/UK114 family)
MGTGSMGTGSMGTGTGSSVTGTTGTRRVSSGAVWEPVVGYSRAVAAGDYVFVSGCTSIYGAEFVHPGDAYAQTRQAIANVESALVALGAGLADVVRTRVYVTDISRWEQYGRAHGEKFAGIMPATSMIQIGALVDPRMLVEVEAIAYKPGIGAGPAASGDSAEAASHGAGPHGPDLL